MTVYVIDNGGIYSGHLTWFLESDHPAELQPLVRALIERSSQFGSYDFVADAIEWRSGKAVSVADLAWDVLYDGRLDDETADRIAPILPLEAIRERLETWMRDRRRMHTTWSGPAATHCEKVYAACDAALARLAAAAAPENKRP